MDMFSFALLFSFVFPAAALGFFGWLALRYVRARESVAGRPPHAVDEAEVRRIEGVVQQLQDEVDMLRERQDFMEKLLEKPRESRSPDSS